MADNNVLVASDGDDLEDVDVDDTKHEKGGDWEVDVADFIVSTRHSQLVLIAAWRFCPFNVKRGSCIRCTFITM